MANGENVLIVERMYSLLEQGNIVEHVFLKYGEMNNNEGSLRTYRFNLLHC